MQYSLQPYVIEPVACAACQVFELALPFQCWLPWRLLSITYPQSRLQQTPLIRAREHTAAILGPFAEADLREIRRTMHAFRSDVLWHVLGSRVAENVLLQAAARRRPRAVPCPFGSELRYSRRAPESQVYRRAVAAACARGQAPARYCRTVAAVRE